MIKDNVIIAQKGFANNMKINQIVSEVCNTHCEGFRGV